MKTRLLLTVLGMIALFCGALLGQHSRIIPQVIAGELGDKDVRTIVLFTNDSSEDCDVSIEPFEMGFGTSGVLFDGIGFSTSVRVPANGTREVVVTLEEGKTLNDFALQYRTSTTFRQCASTVKAQVTYRFLSADGKVCTTYNYAAPDSVLPGQCARLAINQKSSGNEPNSMFGLGYGALNVPEGTTLEVKVFDEAGMEIASGTLPIASTQHRTFLLPDIMEALGAEAVPADFQGTIQLCPKVPEGTDPGDFQMSIVSINTVQNSDGTFHYEVSRQNEETPGCQPGQTQICGSGVGVQLWCGDDDPARFANWKRPHAKADYACTGFPPEAQIIVDSIIPGTMDITVRPNQGITFDLDANVHVTFPGIDEPVIVPLQSFNQLCVPGPQGTTTPVLLHTRIDVPEVEVP